MKFIVLDINSRFYRGISKTNRLETAWCLAGARIFMVYKNNDFVIEEQEQKLTLKKIKFIRREVGLI